jgi:hypothetical protein
LPVQRAYQEKSRVERLCIEAETKARCVIDAVNPSLHIVGFNRVYPLNFDF